MISSFPKDLIVAELGVFKGEFSKIILNEISPKKLYLVDLFQGCFVSGDKDGRNRQSVQLEEELAKLKVFFQNNDNVEIVRSSTTDFLRSVDCLDIVYIDANHTYHAVKSDLDLSFRKVRKGGIICGHDYVKTGEVERAVDEFCLENNLNIDMLTDDGCPSFAIKV
jgi:hypothetical protein